MWMPGPEKDLDAGVIAASSSTLFFIHFIYINAPPNRYIIFLCFHQIWGVFSHQFFQISFTLSLFILSRDSKNTNAKSSVTVLQVSEAQFTFKNLFLLSFELDNIYWSIFSFTDSFLWHIISTIEPIPWVYLLIKFSVLKFTFSSFLYLYFFSDISYFFHLFQECF